MAPPIERALVWCRRDLRADDHAALYHALRHARTVWCAFVFDDEILDPLPREDRRVEFIRDSLTDLDGQLRALGAAHGVMDCGLIVRRGAAREVLPALATEMGVQAVFANHDDDPTALARDTHVRGALAAAGIALHTSKDHVVAERDEILTAAGGPFSVFTAYLSAWRRWLKPEALHPYPVARHASALAPLPAGAGGVPTLESIGFARTNLHRLRLPTGSSGAHELLDDFLDRIDVYDRRRDFPGVKGPSYLSPHLRFGTISIRRVAREAWQRAQAGSRGAEVWLTELVWRDFFHQILHHHAHVVEHAFRPECDAIRWEQGATADAHFDAWCNGLTGYPLVDAAMHQLNQTGWMHNRLRMVAASFLVKHLGLDWRRGEAYFARHLIDYDLAANNGGWQWAASTGCDAQPYFRIFNPVAQSQRYDADGGFIRRYVPELALLDAREIHAPWTIAPEVLRRKGVVLGRDYPPPIVDHARARQVALDLYGRTRARPPRASRAR